MARSSKSFADALTKADKEEWSFGSRPIRDDFTAMQLDCDNEARLLLWVNKSKKLLRVAVLNGRGAVFKSGSDFNAVE